jgi:hypothetical protein
MTPLSHAAEFTMIGLQDWRAAPDHETLESKVRAKMAASVCDSTNRLASPYTLIERRRSNIRNP